MNLNKSLKTELQRREILAEFDEMSPEKKRRAYDLVVTQLFKQRETYEELLGHEWGIIPK